MRRFGTFIVGSLLLLGCQRADQELRKDVKTLLTSNTSLHKKVEGVEKKVEGVETDVAALKGEVAEVRTVAENAPKVVLERLQGRSAFLPAQGADGTPLGPQSETQYFALRLASDAQALATLRKQLNESEEAEERKKEELTLLRGIKKDTKHLRRGMEDIKTIAERIGESVDQEVQNSKNEKEASEAVAQGVRQIIEELNKRPTPPTAAEIAAAMEAMVKRAQSSVNFNSRIEINFSRPPERFYATPVTPTYVYGVPVYYYRYYYGPRGYWYHYVWCG